MGAVRQESFAGRPSDVDLGLIDTHFDIFYKNIDLIKKNFNTIPLQTHIKRKFDKKKFKIYNPDFALIQKKLLNQLLKKNTKVDGVIACAHHPYAKGNLHHLNHPCRKPNGGMFLIAKKLFNLDLKNSWMIGDKINDLKAAYSKGLKGGILVMTGYGKEEKKKLDQLPKKNFIIKTAPSLNKVKITF